MSLDANDSEKEARMRRKVDAYLKMEEHIGRTHALLLAAREMEDPNYIMDEGVQGNSREWLLSMAIDEFEKIKSIYDGPSK